MTQLFANNAATTLAVAVLAGDTTLSVVDGSKFPTPTGGDYFFLTLATGNPETTWEIVKVTARATNSLTVTRAQDGTTAQGWAIGAKAELRLPAQGLRDLLAASPALAPVQSVAGRTGAVTLAVADVSGAQPSTIAVGANALQSSDMATALRGLDGLVMPRVTGYLINTPPATPADGDCYIIGVAPTGAWAGQGGKVTRYSTVTAAWEYYTPKNGWTVESATARESYRYTASAWEIFTAVNRAGDTGLGNMSMGALTATTGTFSGDLSTAGTQGLLITIPGWANTSSSAIMANWYDSVNVGMDLKRRVAGSLVPHLSLYYYGSSSFNGGSVSMGALTATSVNPGTYTVATLPAGTNGASVYASNGRKTGEGAGLGTGVLAIYTNGAWRDPSQAYAVVVA